MRRLCRRPAVAPEVPAGQPPASPAAAPAPLLHAALPAARPLHPPPPAAGSLHIRAALLQLPTALAAIPRPARLALLPLALVPSGHLQPRDACRQEQDTPLQGSALRLCCQPAPPPLPVTRRPEMPRHVAAPQGGFQAGAQHVLQQTAPPAAPPAAPATPNEAVASACSNSSWMVCTITREYRHARNMCADCN